MANPGSWSVLGYRLPDFGITERIGGVVGAPRTAQGGSNILGRSYAQTPTNNTTLYTPPQNIGGYPSIDPNAGGGSTNMNVNTGGGGAQSNNPPAPPVVSTGGGSGISEAEETARRREEETRNAINSGYGEYESRLRGMEGSYGAAKEEELGSASKTYDQIFGGLTEQKQTNLSKLDAGREAVNTRKAQSIKDLQQNLSNTLRGATMQFGAMGAGDTSATRTMLPYAYTKLAGQQEGGIVRQSNEQQFDIDQESRDTELQFSNMWKDTEVQKEQQLQSIRGYYGDAIRNVQLAIASAPADKARDLAALSQSLLAEAQSNLRVLEADDRQRKQTVQNWATERISQLNSLKLELAGSANFQPQDILWSELPMMGGNVATSGGDSFYNPMLMAQKRRQDYLG